jgi:anti-anti-sigma regulatory factor
MSFAVLRGLTNANRDGVPSADRPPATSMSTTRPPPGTRTLVLLVAGRVAAADVPNMCERVRVVLEKCGAASVVCDVGAVVDPDAVMVDAIVRLQLTTRRLGRRFRLHRASPALRHLLEFMGLSDVVSLDVDSRIEARRQLEEWEQALGVEEEGDPADPTC